MGTPHRRRRHFVPSSLPEAHFSSRISANPLAALLLLVLFHTSSNSSPYDTTPARSLIHGVSIPLALVVLRPGSPPTLPPESTPPVPRTTYTKIPDRPSRLLRILRSIDLGTTNFDLHLSDSQPSISRWHTDLPLGRALACEFPQPPAQKDAQRCLCSSTRLSRTLPL